MSFERSGKKENNVGMGSSECSREEAEIKLDFEVNTNLWLHYQVALVRRAHVITQGRKGKVL